ncbi:MAG: hydrogenase nickel incorporation protein HypB [Nostocoides sp.]
MGRFHRHDDGTVHDHDHDHHGEPADPLAHGDMSAYATGTERVVVLERIFDENDRAAERNRNRLEEAGVTAINLMSSPGAGKTTLLARTLAELSGEVRCGVVEGDIETSIDADRLAGFGAQVSLLNTSDGFGGECHLDAPMVARALDSLDLPALDVLFVENVGNLVCPAEFDVGAQHRAMVYSITEGEEKPLKYPVMFRAVDLVIVNKADLIPYLDADLATFEENLRRINPTAELITLSARTGEGMDAWIDWVRQHVPAVTPT